MSAVIAVEPEPPVANAPLPTLRDIFGQLHCRPDIPNETYHADRSCVSVSGLKEILRSPAHFQAYLQGFKHKETPAMFLGTAVHARLLEPHLYVSEYAVAPTSDKRLSEYKQFILANANKRILTPDQNATIEGIAASVSQHVSATTLLRAGRVEHSIIWQDEETGIWQKIRPDCLCVDFDTGICLDVKKTIDASKDVFVRACVNYNYDMQAAMYLEGLRYVFQRDFDFIFLPVEEDAPYGCALYGVPQEMLDRGHRRYREALHILKRCLDSGQWPCYQPAGDYDILDWPRWAT
jgi:hypothetical protein